MKEGFECVACPVLEVVLLLLFLGAIAFISALVFKMHAVKSGGYTKKDIFFKVLVSSFQLNGLALYLITLITLINLPLSLSPSKINTLNTFS